MAKEEWLKLPIEELNQKIETFRKKERIFILSTAGFLLTTLMGLTMLRNQDQKPINFQESRPTTEQLEFNVPLTLVSTILTFLSGLAIFGERKNRKYIENILKEKISSPIA